MFRMLLEGSLNGMRDRVEAVPDSHWARTVVPGTSRMGFVLFHSARTFDWAVHAVVQGVPEFADDPTWHDRLAPDALFGAGIPDALADTVPERVSRDTIRDYVEALREAVHGWLPSVTPDSLDTPVDLRSRLAHRPDYLQPSVWEEIHDLDGIPAWQFLLRPAIAHIRTHGGEVDVLTEIAKAGAPA